jgi:predicted ester cyclase
MEVERSRAIEVVRRFVGAMSHDLDTMAACLDEDYLRYGIETGWQPMTKATYMAMARNFVVPFPDCTWTITDLVADDGAVAVQLIEAGTFSEPWVVGDVTIAPNGVRYEMRGAVFFSVNQHNLIQRYTYIHSGTFAQTYADVMTDEFYRAYADVLMGDVGAPEAAM